mgnify:CR=1 FL=1
MAPKRIAGLEEPGRRWSGVEDLDPGSRVSRSKEEIDKGPCGTGVAEAKEEKEGQGKAYTELDRSPG